MLRYREVIYDLIFVKNIVGAVAAAGVNFCVFCHKASKTSQCCIYKDSVVAESSCRIYQVEGQRYGLL